MTPPPIQFKTSHAEHGDVSNRPRPSFAIDVKVVHQDGTASPLTRSDVETAYETGVPIRGTCECEHGFVHDGFVTPQGLFAKSWRPPLSWDVGRLKWAPLVTLEGDDFTAAFRPSIAKMIGKRCRVVTDFGVLEGGRDPYPPGHPYTPGNCGIDKVARNARHQVRANIHGNVRYALVKGDKGTFFEGRETTRNTLMLVYEATLSDSELATLRAVLEAEVRATYDRVRANLADGEPLILPASRAAEAAPVVGTLGMGGSLGGGVYGDEDDAVV